MLPLLPVYPENEGKTYEGKSLITFECFERVFILHEIDAELFNLVVEWGSKFEGGDISGRTLDAALEHFGLTEYSDAVCRAIFASSSTIYDGVVIYNIKMGNMHERELLVRGLVQRRIVIELERGDDENERRLLLLCPFESLCIEAEALEFKMDLKSTSSDKYDELSQDSTSAPLNSADTSGDNNSVSPGGLTARGSMTLPSAESFSTPSTVLKAIITRKHADPDRRTALFRFKDLVKFAGGDPMDWQDVIMRLPEVNEMKAHKLGAIEVKFHFFSPSARNNLSQNIVFRLSVNLWKLLADKTVLKFFSPHDGPCEPIVQMSADKVSTHVHETNFRSEIYLSLKKCWGGPLLFLAYEPYQQIRFYFGEKIALYFAWLSFYTQFCGWASFFGLIVFCYGVFKASNEPEPARRILALFDNELTPLFALIVAVWSTLFLEFWKRFNAYLSHEWNVNDYERRELIRPQWRFDPHCMMKNPITGVLEPYDPRIQRFLRRFASSIVIIGAIIICVTLVSLIIVYRAWFAEMVGGDWGHTWAGVTASLISLLIIAITNPLYAWMARKLTDFENHRTETKYQNALILKSFIFAAINQFSSVFYIAVVKSILSSELFTNFVVGVYPDNCQELWGIRSCMSELMLQMAVIFIGLPVIHQLQEALGIDNVIQGYRAVKMALCWPFRRQRGDKGADKGTNLSNRRQYLLDQTKQVYTDEHLGADYVAKVIQFGFITLFSCAFPLAPLFVLVSNTFEIRVDTFKLLKHFQRPWARRAQDIGLVQTLLYIMSNLGVLTNAIVIAFASASFQRVVVYRFPEEAHLVVRILFVVLFEHVVLFIKLLITSFISSTPRDVRIAQERQAYRAAVATMGKAVISSESFDECACKFKWKLSAFCCCNGGDI